jgi:NADPH2:quinone reductase
MKAIRVQEFGPSEVLQLADVPNPQAGPGQVVVRLQAIGINPVETYIRSGSYAKLPALPYTPGGDGAGIIEHLGGDVNGLERGQRVYVAGSISGTYAENAVCDAAQVRALPDGISFEQGAALGVPYATAHFALFTRGNVQPGENVLVHGASGGVGLAAVQFAKEAGSRVIGTAGTEEGRTLVQAQGAAEVVDHTAPDYAVELLAHTNGRGFDVIIEMLANVNLARDLMLLAPRGRVVVVGSRGPIGINPREIMARNADVRGVMLFGGTTDELAAAHAAIRTGLESGACVRLSDAAFLSRKPTKPITRSSRRVRWERSSCCRG